MINLIALGLSSCFILLGIALIYANSGNTGLDGLYIITSISDGVNDISGVCVRPLNYIFRRANGHHPCGHRSFPTIKKYYPLNYESSVQVRTYYNANRQQKIFLQYLLPLPPIIWNPKIRF